MVKGCHLLVRRIDETKEHCVAPHLENGCHDVDDIVLECIKQSVVCGGCGGFWLRLARIDSSKSKMGAFEGEVPLGDVF